MVRRLVVLQSFCADLVCTGQPRASQRHSTLSVPQHALSDLLLLRARGVRSTLIHLHKFGLCLVASTFLLRDVAL